MAQRIIYWFRNDLRLHDNEAFYHAVNNSSEIIPVYVLDPRQFEYTRLGFRRTGAARAQLMIESVVALRQKLRSKGGDLLIRVGMPEKVISQIAEEYNADYVYTTKEIGPKETRIESSLSKHLKIANIDIKLIWIDNLVKITALPFSIAKLPLQFESYVAKTQHLPIPTDLFPIPESMNMPATYDAGPLPTLTTLGIDPNELNGHENDQPKKGGESTGIAILDDWAGKLRTANLPMSIDPLADARLTIYLSLGCLSSKQVYRKIMESNLDTEVAQAAIRSLMRRDFAHFTLLRYGPRLFKLSGLQHRFDLVWKNDTEGFNRWKAGVTDDETINKIMQKLSHTGFPSITERYQAANYLTKILKINWIWGAMYFESLLLDYDVAISWGKWNTIAQVGID